MRENNRERRKKKRKKKREREKERERKRERERERERTKCETRKTKIRKDYRIDCYLRREREISLRQPRPNSNNGGEANS